MHALVYRKPKDQSNSKRIIIDTTDEVGMAVLSTHTLAL